MKKVVVAIEKEYREMLCLGRTPLAISVDEQTFRDLCKELNTVADEGVHFLVLHFPGASIPVIWDDRYIKCVI